MDIEKYFKNRKESKIRNMQILDENLISYINKEIENKTYFSNLEESKYWGRKLLLPTAILFDSSCSLEEKVFPFKGPYLWGKLFYSTSEVVEKVVASMHQQKSMNGIDDYNANTTIHYHISDLEEYLGSKVPLRSFQKKWLEQPSDYFIGLIENFKVTETYPYQYLAFFWDRDTNEQYMAILWNKDEKKDENEKPIIF